MKMKKQQHKNTNSFTSFQTVCKKLGIYSCLMTLLFWDHNQTSFILVEKQDSKWIFCESLQVEHPCA